jgi:hypothetical protein
MVIYNINNGLIKCWFYIACVNSGSTKCFFNIVSLASIGYQLFGENNNDLSVMHLLHCHSSVILISTVCQNLGRLQIGSLLSFDQ